MKVTQRWAYCMYFEGTIDYPDVKDKENQTEEEQRVITQWEYKDSVASYLLTQRLPDTTTLRLRCDTVTTEERGVRLHRPD